MGHGRRHHGHLHRPRHAKKNSQIFRNSTIRICVPRQTGGVLQALAQADIDEAIATATTPDIRLIVALAAVHAARPKMIRTMQMDDVDLGNRRITVGGHIRPLDDLTHRAVLDWLGHRRNRWPKTANPHLLITQETAVELGPAGKLRTTGATRNLTAILERLRVDRQLEEALTHGATRSTSRSSSKSMRRPPSVTRTRRPHLKSVLSRPGCFIAVQVADRFGSAGAVDISCGR